MTHTPAENLEFIRNLDAALRRQYRVRRLPGNTPDGTKQAILKAFIGSDNRPSAPAARKAA